jgi:hypothetical protein
MKAPLLERLQYRTELQAFPGSLFASANRGLPFL